VSSGPQCAATTTFPSLVVFDLDNTLWTPELYQLRQIERLKRFPVAGKDVKLFPVADDIIQQIRIGKYPGTKFAVASRTKSVEWAQNLLDQFNLREIFDLLRYFPVIRSSILPI
jgi:magnesium-dependent phosphatase 1